MTTDPVQCSFGEGSYKEENYAIFRNLPANRLAKVLEWTDHIIPNHVPQTAGGVAGRMYDRRTTIIISMWNNTTFACIAAHIMSQSIERQSGAALFWVPWKHFRFHNCVL